MEALLHLSLSGGTVLDPEQHARQALGRLVSLLHCDRGILFLASEEGRLRPAAAYRLGHFVALDQPYNKAVLQEAVDKREPVRVADAMTDPRFGDRSSVVESGLRAIIAAPLLAHNRLVGAVYLDHRLASGLFKEGDLVAVTALGNHIAQALETSRAGRLEARLQAERRERELADILLETMVSLTSTLEPAEVLERLLLGLARVVPFDHSQVFLEGLESEEGALCVEVGPGGFRLWREAGGFEPHERQLARLFASQASMALENARLFKQVQEMATVDQLTGVWSRRHLLAMTEQALKRARRTQKPLSVLLLDVDHFKKFNDTHGHHVGDEVLREVAQRCRQSLRDSDIFGRYGGEEFVAALPDSDLVGAAQTAERLGAAVRDQPLRELRITVSQGLACLAGEESLEGLLQRADQALYRAKAEGRDCYRLG